MMRMTIKMLSNFRVLIRSILKSLLLMLLFALVYSYSNNEHIREGVGDKGFDIFNKFLSVPFKSSMPKAPPILLFGYDNDYMLYHHLWDEDNNTNYGNLFHRSNIVAFIEALDNRTQRLKAYQQAPPKALFIDFDLSFTLFPDGQTLSAEDEALLNVLKKERDYVIILPKTQTANFVEQSDDPKIQELIKKQQIIFASVGFSVSQDNTVRRYRTYESYHERGEEHKYSSAEVVLWQLAQNYPNPSTLPTGFKQRDVVANRILFKGYETTLPIQSKWKNLKHYSVLRHFGTRGEKVVTSNYAGAIVMLGTTYSNNGDTFEVLNIFGNKLLSGVEIHTHALMTLFEFDGQLKLLPFWLTMMIVFGLYFMVDYPISKAFNRWEIKMIEIRLLVPLTLALLLMAMISWVLLQFGYWFDWFAPTVLFDIII